MNTPDFEQAPFLAIWETTRSCGLACSHCRAEAVLGRDPLELTTSEGKNLLDQAAGMEIPIVILSGGDPLNRRDIEELVRHGKAQGLRLGTIPAATDNLTRKRIFALKRAGLDQIAFSLDGPTADIHDSFRGVPGSFAKTLEGVAFAHEAGIPLQINSCFAAWNFSLLESMISMVRSLGIVFWEVFFLIPIGRGQALDGLTSEQFEIVFERLYRLSLEERFIVKLTEAQHYKRYILQHGDPASDAAGGAGPMRHAANGLGTAPRAVNAGNGFVFIDHVGNICPSGFLPLTAGNIRQNRLADVYRDSPIFRDLREPNRLKGKCGACSYKVACGGSRARAWAVSGDYFAEDPFCAYVPPSDNLTHRRS